jgi:hypothetical protein
MNARPDKRYQDGNSQPISQPYTCPIIAPSNEEGISYDLQWYYGEKDRQSAPIIDPKYEVGHNGNHVRANEDEPQTYSLRLLSNRELLINHAYLSFNVVNANSANTSARIQNRVITFDSDHPINSK